MGFPHLRETIMARVRVPCDYERAKQFGRRYEHIKPSEIFERDKWVCQLCGKKL